MVDSELDREIQAIKLGAKERNKFIFDTFKYFHIFSHIHTR